MQNKRIGITRQYQKRGIIQAHIMNNLKNYAIVTIFFLVRYNFGRIIYK